jgi:hypothetical protein
MVKGRLLFALCLAGLLYYQYNKWHAGQVSRNIRPSTDTISPWTAHYRRPKAPSKDERGCPYYHDYSRTRHGPVSKGPLELAFQRPSKECRTFSCEHVEGFIDSVVSHIRDPDLARQGRCCTTGLILQGYLKIIIPILWILQ